MWVRPAFTVSANWPAFAARASASCSIAGSSCSRTSETAARCTAEGNTSFEDCPMFTWSLGCTPSPARLAITSLAFVFVEVPEPVWKTSIGNWSSCSPAATSSPARATRSATSGSRRPSSPFTRAASALRRPSQRTTGTGTRSPDTGKFSTALLVSAPHSSCRTAMPLLGCRPAGGYRPAKWCLRLAFTPRTAAFRSRRRAISQSPCSDRFEPSYVRPHPNERAESGLPRRPPRNHPLLLALRRRGMTRRAAASRFAAASVPHAGWA